MTTLAIVSPCYNEEAVLESSAARLRALFDQLIGSGKISDQSFVVFVNDGSKDRTWSIIQSLHTQDKTFRGVNLASNVGHQNAIMAGMMYTRDKADAIITIDADLQDDLNAIEKMVQRYEEGNDIVYGVKVSRKADSLMKRTTATTFYKMQKMLGVKTVYNHADFRLMSNRAINALACYDERNLYLRGIVPLLGYQTCTVDDIISERLAGESKYTLSKMLGLALNGVTSFSVKPINLILELGIIFIFVCILILGYVLGSMLYGHVTAGWASIMLSIWFVGGVILIALGIIGQYIGRIFIEVKRRPLYNIQEILQ